MRDNTKSQVLSEFERKALLDIMRLAKERERCQINYDAEGFGVAHLQIQKIKKQLAKVVGKSNG